MKKLVTFAVMLALGISAKAQIKFTTDGTWYYRFRTD